MIESPHVRRQVSFAIAQTSNQLTSYVWLRLQQQKVSLQTGRELWSLHYLFWLFLIATNDAYAIYNDVANAIFCYGLLHFPTLKDAFFHFLFCSTAKTKS